MKQFDSFGLDTSNECLWRNNAQITLPPKPFAVLRYLVENPGRLVTHDELLDALWPETFVQPQVLRTYMLELRKVLEDDARNPRFIQTLPKRGYRFVAPVTDLPPVERPATLAEAVIAATPAAAPAPIVDRANELSRLEAHAQRMAGGHRQVVFVTGETGIGKTALVDAFCRLQGSQASVARGQCVQGFGRDEAYYPVMEALGQLCSSADGELACRVLARLAPAWLAALGRLPESLEGSFARPAPQERLLADLCAALEEIAAEKPLILVFEDLHWADEATLDLISALARRRAPARLLVLATFRPHDAASRHRLKELRQDLLMRRLGASIELAPLSRPAMQQLLARELGQGALPAELAEFVHRHSEGNPLFAIAVLEHLIAQGVLVRGGANGESGWRQRSPFAAVDAAVPGELAQMIELEIERLGERDQRLLEAGSLMNVAFPAWAAAAVLEEDAIEIEDEFDALARRLNMVKRAGEDELPDGSRSAFYVFAHEVYREVLYRRQPPSRRAKSHIRVAERLGRIFAGRETAVAREIAIHYEAAGDWPRAASALRAAAQHALERQALSEAEELLERTLRVAENLRDADRQALIEEIQNESAAMRQVFAAMPAPRSSLPKKLDDFWTGI
ncbi:MAG TPA: AAA family ATPase [Terracidiphilus sp.]|nr:AAA family ATPase [Terracidiphilus sp.]